MLLKPDIRGDGGIMTRGRSTTCAFTLVEILAVVIILGIFVAVVAPRILTTASTAKINSCYQNKIVINQAAERWHFDTGTWPDHRLDDIGNDPNYFPDGKPACLIDAEEYHLNHTTYRVDNHVH